MKQKGREWQETLLEQNDKNFKYVTEKGLNLATEVFVLGRRQTSVSQSRSGRGSPPRVISTPLVY